MKKGGGKKKKRCCNKKTSILLKYLTNYDRMYYAKALNIPNIRGVYIRHNLPIKPRRYESTILNLDSASGTGTHWVANRKLGKK